MTDLSSTLSHFMPAVIAFLSWLLQGPQLATLCALPPLAALPGAPETGTLCEPTLRAHAAARRSRGICAWQAQSFIAIRNMSGRCAFCGHILTPDLE